MTPGQTLIALWWMTTGPRTKPVTVERLTPKQVLTIDGSGREDRFWRATGREVGGVLHLMTGEEADRVAGEWCAREAQRRAAATDRPVAVPTS